jgi:hypothetical protein
MINVGILRQKTDENSIRDRLGWGNFLNYIHLVKITERVDKSTTVNKLIGMCVCVCVYFYSKTKLIGSISERNRRDLGPLILGARNATRVLIYSLLNLVVTIYNALTRSLTGSVTPPIDKIDHRACDQTTGYKYTGRQFHYREAEMLLTRTVGRGKVTRESQILLAPKYHAFK